MQLRIKIDIQKLHDCVKEEKKNIKRSPMFTSQSHLEIYDSIQRRGRWPATIRPHRAEDICASQTRCCCNLNNLTGDRT